MKDIIGDDIDIVGRIWFEDLVGEVILDRSDVVIDIDFTPVDIAGETRTR